MLKLARVHASAQSFDRCVGAGADKGADQKERGIWGRSGDENANDHDSVH